MNEVLAILHDIRPEFDFSTSEDYFGEGMLDSFDIIMLVSALDKRFSISIDGTEIVPENFCNLAAIHNVLQKHGVAA
jgi:acyl carrier protein